MKCQRKAPMLDLISSARRQPRLCDLVTVVNAPASVVSDPLGDLGGGIEGYYLDDRRLLSTMAVAVGEVTPEPVSATLVAPYAAEFVSVVPGIAFADGGFGLDGDPQISLTRRRMLGAHGSAAGLVETFVLRSSAREQVTATLRLTMATDGVSVTAARAGKAAPLVTPRLMNGTARWRLVDVEVTAAFTEPPDEIVVDAIRGTLTAAWSVKLDPGATWSTQASVSADDCVAQASSARPPSATVSGSERVERLFARSVADVYALVRHDSANPADRYVCAGAPWYLTLFGRDSIWSARMLLPVDLDLALGTLRVLARYQGTRHNPGTGEQPGKILHELRREKAADLLPPQYYGTADATSMWISLLVETWRWGAEPDDLEPLLPHLDAALGWLAEHADADGDGFVEYLPDPAGLAHQGWKDSPDSVHDAAGRDVGGALALAEVQGYAYQAALGAADLLDAFGRPGGPWWRRYARELRDRFRASFWSSDSAGPYPALAIGDGGRRADAVGSNMGHLLGTGIVDASEAAQIAARLGARELDSGFGLRTLSSASPRFNPISYHNGSVWPHDTAIAVAGLVAHGQYDVARSLAGGVLNAGAAFDYRLPELWSGIAAANGIHGSSPRPLPYLTACAPQGWAAAAAVSLVISSLGLRVDIPAGTVTLCPPRPALLGPLRITGIRLPGGCLDVRIDKDGTPEVLSAPTDIRLVVDRQS